MYKRTIAIVAALLALVPIWGASPAAAAPPGGGTISIEPKTADGDYDRSMPAFVNAASDALAAKGDGADLVRDWDKANDEIDSGHVEPFRSNVAEWDALGYVNPPRLALQSDVPPGQFHYDGPSQ